MIVHLHAFGGNESPDARSGTHHGIEAISSFAMAALVTAIRVCFLTGMKTWMRDKPAHDDVGVGRSDGCNA